MPNYGYEYEFTMVELNKTHLLNRQIGYKAIIIKTKNCIKLIIKLYSKNPTSSKVQVSQKPS